jgi:hypothetical protein
MFAADFGDEINHYANLVNQKGNQFEVLVERINNVFLTHGWYAIRDFYGIRIGALIWILRLIRPVRCTGRCSNEDKIFVCTNISI